MTTNSRRRLLRDFKKVTSDPPAGIMAAPDPEDLLTWQAVIFGPDDTPWEGATFRLVMRFSEEYPNKPPVVKFITKLFHPNIYTDGAICLDILANQWSPIYDVGAILASIQSLLTDPNPNSPANVEAAKLYVENRREYDRKVAEVVEALWKQEEDEAAAAGEDGEDEEEKDEDAAPRKKQKLTETTSLASNASAPTTSLPVATTVSSPSLPSSSSSAAPAASSSTSVSSSAAANAASSSSTSQ